MKQTYIYCLGEAATYMPASSQHPGRIKSVISQLGSLELQISGGAHQPGPVMGRQHICKGQNWCPEAPLPEDPKESSATTKTADQLLQMHHRVSHYVLNNSLVLQLHLKHWEGPVTNHQNCPADHQHPVPTLEDMHYARCACRAINILRDHIHPCHRFFTLLPFVKHYRTIRTRTTQFKNSFYPTAIRFLNSLCHLSPFTTPGLAASITSTP